MLSGGEKARLVLALMLYDPPNFLVLDEPTNHLDIATKEMLIEALADFEGTMLFVSHDRHFLAALSNRVLELTPEGLHQYGGGYTEYVARAGPRGAGLAGVRVRAWAAPHFSFIIFGGLAPSRNMLLILSGERPDFSAISRSCSIR